MPLLQCEEVLSGGIKRFNKLWVLWGWVYTDAYYCF